MAQGQGAHHHRRSRGDDVHQAGGGLERCHHQIAAHPGEFAQGRHNGDGQCRQARRGRDQDGEGQVQGEHQQREADGPGAGKGLLSPVEDRVGDGAVVHQHSDAPADADDKGHAQKVRAAGHVGLYQLLLTHPVNEADDDTCHQEQGGELRKPPAQSGQGQAHLVKGHHSIDHDEECQRKEGHDDLPLGGKGHLLVHAYLDLARAHAHHGFGGVLLDLRGVGHHKPDGRRLKGHPLQQPQHDTLSQRDPGKARGDASGKGVHRGGDDAGPGPQQDHADAHYRVVPGRQEHRDQQGIKGHGLLPHAVGGAAQAEQQHQNGDQPLLPAAQQADDVAHAGVHGTGLHHHAQKAAHHQDEDAHVHRVVKARKSCLQNVAHSLGILLHRVVRPRHRHAVHVVIAARRDDPGGGSHQDQQQEQDRIGCGHVEFFLIQDIYPASVLTPRRQHHFHHVCRQHACRQTSFPAIKCASEASACR